MARTGLPLLERQLIAHLCKNPKQAEDFYNLGDILVDPLSKVVYKMILEGTSGNAVTLAGALTKSFKPYTPEQVQKDLLQLADPVWGSFDPRSVADQIEVHAKQEEGLALYEQTLLKLRSGAESLQSGTEALYEDVMRLALARETQGISTSEWEDWGLKQAELQKQKVTTGHIITLSKNLERLAKLVPRIPEGILFSYIALPGTGKTSIAMELAHHWGRTTRRPVMFCNTELTQPQLFWRRMSAMTRTPYDFLENGGWNDKIAKAARDSKDDGVLYVNVANWTVREILAAAMRYKVKPHIVIDYMTMLTWKTGNGQTETEAIRVGLNELKQYAGKYEVTVLCNWQTGKEGHNKILLRASDANGSYAPYTASNLFLAGNFPIAKEQTFLKDPFTHEKIVIDPGKAMPCGDIMVERHTFGKSSGQHQMVWRDEFFTLRGLDEVEAETFKVHVLPMFSASENPTYKKK